MESNNSEDDDASSNGRWTCEACGCNTNQQSDSSCSICGTSNSGFSILRRHGAAYAARAGWLARRSNRTDEVMDAMDEDDDFLEAMVDNMAAVAAVGDLDSRLLGHARLVSAANGRRLLEAARALTQQQRNPAPDSSLILRIATANGPSYSPSWISPSHLFTSRGRRSQHFEHIQVGEGDRQHIAFSPTGTGEGRAVRAETALPRDPDGSMVTSLPNPRRAFGFRVAFDLPSVEAGGIMGGGHWIGVVTSSYSGYHEPNSVHKSPFFWGIDDAGQKCEGSTSSTIAAFRSAAVGERRNLSVLASDPVSGRISVNATNALFGCRDTVTVVCDYETSTLTFWRNEALLGSLVSNLPPSGDLYPVAVPFTSGASVAITGITEDPLSLLKAFASDCLRNRQGKEEDLRKKRLSKRSRFIHDGQLTKEIKDVLQDIFLLYTENSDLQVSSAMAHRLWYRCGLRLSSLNDIFTEKDNEKIEFHDFLKVVIEVVTADDAENDPSLSCVDSNESFCEVGDTVELAEGYEKLSDSAGGPLQPGDRASVIEIQRGPNGERRSIRVLHSGRRWWYQPQAIVSERSGLIDSAAVWFLSALLRAHGYDADTLESMQGRQVSTSSWLIGDVVVPKKAKDEASLDASVGVWCGRIVPESHSSRTPCTPHSRDAGTALVEFVGGAFAQSVGLKLSASSDQALTLFVRRVRTSKLLHSSALHIRDYCVTDDKTEDDASEKTTDKVSSVSPVGEKLRSEVSAIGRLEQSAIELIARECKKNPETLPGLFGVGLPAAVLSAVDIAAKQTNSLEPREDLSEKITAIGMLLKIISEKLYSDDSDVECDSSENEDMDNESVSSDNGHFSSQQVMIPGDGHAARALSASRRDNVSDMASSMDIIDSSLRQRRGMLSVLLSRSESNRGGNSLHELSERRRLMDLDVARPFGSRSFVFGSSVDDQSNSEELWGTIRSATGVNAPETSAATVKVSVLDSLLRCRGVSTETLNSNRKQGSPSVFLFLRQLVSCGILANNKEWTQALLDSFQSKKNTQQRSSKAVLRNAVDEDGIPVLRLAILMGCSPSIIRILISFGAPVGLDELRKAAYTNQPKTLAVLLQQYSSFTSDAITIEQCSDDVREILRKAKARQNELDRQMREAAGDFIASVVKKLVSLGLSTRRNPSPRTAVCNQVVGRILVGDIILEALQRAQKMSSNSDVIVEAKDETDRSGRVPLDDGMHTLIPGGVLRLLPVSVLGETLFSDQESATTFFLLLEEYLCSKDLSDTAAGLALYKVFLANFPQLRNSSLLERYGFNELVSLHDSLASNRISDILSRDFASGLDVSTEATSESTNVDTPSKTWEEIGVVTCPKKHTAMLHITRHSSFRCDICGCGVERGMPMHGCRECDWDACEHCTDKSESGLIKCNAIRQLAREALRLSSEDVSDSEMEEKMSDFPHGDVVEEMANDDVLTPLNAIVSKLLQRDVEAMKQLGVLLHERGRVSFYQFLCFVLPALHESLSGKPSHNDTSTAARSGRKTKKPRCSEGSTISSGVLFDYCRDSVTFLLDAPPDKSSVETLNTDEKVPSRALDSSKEIAYSTLGSELLRRIHQALTLYENVREISTSTQTLDVAGGDKGRSDLHALTKAIEIQISNENQAEESLSFLAEPLILMSDVEMQILRSQRIEDSKYLGFCRSLAADTAIILERARLQPTDSWRIVMVTGFDEKTGVHSVRCVSKLSSRPMSDEVVLNTSTLEDEIIFDQESIHLMLALREFVIVKRANVHTKQVSNCTIASQVDKLDAASHANGTDLSSVIGQRVERILPNGDKAEVLTLVGVDVDPSSSSENNLLATLVSDDGTVITGVPSVEIHLQDRDLSADQGEGRESSIRASLRRGLPYPFAGRRRSTENPVADSRKTCLRRTWSAISLASNLRPLDIKIPEGVSDGSGPGRQNKHGDRWWPCQIDTANIVLYGDASTVEMPPRISVIITARDKMGHPSVVTNRTDSLTQTLMSQGTDWRTHSLCKLSFSVNVEYDPSNTTCVSKIASTTPPPPPREPSSHETFKEHGFNEAMEWSPDRTSRSRKVSARSPSLEVEGKREVLCDGFDDICLQCMEVIGIIAQHASDTSEGAESDRPNIPRFANPNLSKKLSSQLDDALCVVGDALPRWCTFGPAFSPRVFSYASRQLLLRRAAFGVSRGILKQQECKIDVGKLRQRMAALRARAVELMGEAFSGGAEDPTALQLQADELYGMEEALAARVRSAFRSAKWQEHSLEVVKAAVRREKLLLDAAHVMDKYATDSKVNRRRLEVRFAGESGFDAASGDEAGVTRGFYADVAEALLNSETVASVLPSSNCDIIPTEDESTSRSRIAFGQTDKETSRLPLWIPDMDASGQVIIPTPRADPKSCLGVYPRPLPSYHPRLPEVEQAFRFMGRLFAAAMRDGFMFPLPISASFLRLVQSPVETVRGLTDSKLLPTHDLLLTAADLPRPGFLGGEVYAADVHICRALDDLDGSEPPLTSVELQRRYRELAEDKNFARTAFGASYDCSFEEYFQDRTFVDPLDPTQGDEAFRLCHRGHKKAVTIYNIREWVALSKNFMLLDGVEMQAAAFREGIEDFFQSKFLRLFTSEELQRDVCGAGDNVDDWDEGAIRKLFKLNGGKGATEALVAVAAIGGEGGAALSRRFGPSSPTISFLVKALVEAKPKQRRQFLSFVTSVPIVTPGRIEIVPIVSPSGEYLPFHDPSCLPRANTCARRLYLPKFDTFESFAQVLWAVVEEESRFKGFYEWRGSNT